MRDTKVPSDQNSSFDLGIGQRIRMARVDASLTQSDLGNALGCSAQQIHKYESGSNRVSAGTLYFIAQIVGQPVQWFFLEAAIYLKESDTTTFAVT